MAVVAFFNCPTMALRIEAIWLQVGTAAAMPMRNPSRIKIFIVVGKSATVFENSFLTFVLLYFVFRNL